MPPDIFALVIFHIGSCFILGRVPPFYVSHLAGMTGMHHHAKLFLVEIGCGELFCQAGLKP
jgi:hypothetical protein